MDGTHMACEGKGDGCGYQKETGHDVARGMFV